MLLALFLIVMRFTSHLQTKHLACKVDGFARKGHTVDPCQFGCWVSEQQFSVCFLNIKTT